MTLDYTGVRIVAVDDSGTETDVTAQCTFDPPEGSDVPDVPGPVQVTATYEEDGEVFKTSFDLTVRRIVEVTVTAEPTKKSYVVGETIDMTGLAVTATCSDGTTLDVTADCTTAPADGTTVQTAGAIITEVFYKGLLVGQFEMTAREIIAGGEWWTLYGDGELEIFFDGDMPDYNYGSPAPPVYPPWHSYMSDILTVTVANKTTSIGSYAFHYCTSLISVTIPASVISIGSYAFNNCTNLTSATIPEGVTEIGEWAFNHCSLTSAFIPRGVTIIKESTFNYNTNLTSVTISEGVTEIKVWAFNHCTSLISVIIPSSVNFIEAGAFGDCRSLTDVYYTGTQEQWRQITIEYNPFLTSATIHYNSSGPT